jgi:hypothetical protein
MLGWLSGDWRVETDTGWVEETWTAPHGSRMLGLGREVDAGPEDFFEFLRIDDDGAGRVVYHAMPMGRTAVDFPLADLKPGEALFENLAHDFPQRIRYRSEDGGRVLFAEIEGPGHPSQSWRLRRVH